MAKEKYRAKQHDGYVHLLDILLMSLIKEKYLVSPVHAPRVKEYKDALAGLTDAKEERGKLMGDCSRFAKEIDDYVKSSSQKIADSKDAIIDLLRGSWDEKVINEKVAVLEVDEKKFQAELQEKQGNLAMLNDRCAYLSEQITAYGKDLDRIPYYREVGNVTFAYHFGLSTSWTFRFVESLRFLSSNSLRLNMVPEYQNERARRILEFVPEWNVLRLAYIVIFSELVTWDDYRDVKRDYFVGFGSEIKEKILTGRDPLIFRDYDTDYQKTNLEQIRELDAFLRKPLTVDQFFEDPLIAQFCNENQKKGKGNVFKGGNTFRGQLLEFMASLQGQNVCVEEFQ